MEGHDRHHRWCGAGGAAQATQGEAEKPTCVHACLRMNECTYLELVRAGEDIGLRKGALRGREHVGEIRVRAALNNAVVRLI